MTAVTQAPQALSRYRVEGVIGQGPSATVFKAYDPVGERPVVIKVLRREVALRALGPRLLEQARAAARLSHPGIVSIHDVEQSDAASAIVMEFVSGQNLADWLAASPLPHPGVVLQVMDQMLQALAFAHHAGFRHGALHAGNVLVTATGLVKLADFGLARLSEPATISQAMRGLVAPEIAQGRPLDIGVDIYAAGVLLYRMLTGRDPEPGTPAGGPAFPIGGARAPSTFAQAQRSTIFDPIVARALAREPGDRYASAEAFREALAAALEAPRPVHGTQSVEISHGEADDYAEDVTWHAARAGAPASAPAPAPRSHLSLVPQEGPVQRPARIASEQVAVDQPDCDDPTAARRPAAVPMLTIAIPHEEGVRDLIDQAERGRRGRVVSAARAASEVLAAVASSTSAGADDAALIEAEAFEPPSESVFQDDAALPLANPESPGIPSEALRRALKILTPHFGARAGTVLKRVAGEAASVAELHALLVEHAGETVDRRRLKKQLQALARMPL